VSGSPDPARIRVSWQALTLALVAALAAAVLMVVPAHAAISNYYVNCRRNFEYKDSGGTWRLGTYTVEVRVSVDTAQSNKIVGPPLAEQGQRVAIDHQGERHRDVLAERSDRLPPRLGVHVERRLDLLLQDPDRGVTRNPAAG
jgi:hypothetical protein